MTSSHPHTPLASADRSHSDPADHPTAASDLAAQASNRQAAPPQDASPQDAAAHGRRPHGAGGQAVAIPPIKSGLPLRKRAQEVRRIAIEVFPAADSWVMFYREILGVDGVVRKLFKGVEEIRHWESTDEFLEIQEMLTALRSNDSGKGESVEPQRMITVRLPTSLHETLKLEAEEHQTSMNKLCLSKLMMNISDRLVPTESGRIRGRRPGPQGKRKGVTDRISSEDR